MGGLTDGLLYRIHWFLFKWNLNAVKWKVILTVAVNWVADGVGSTASAGVSPMGTGLTQPANRTKTIIR